ncbi:MAG: septation ring formation regulator EzrA [Actinobacteria bacterium HGW-Actinobacteria-4]|nr:MAG: septation ring formation regulator EzrA [Actinobacteria bacterium HGW-Actinobacteria-4]
MVTWRGAVLVGVVILSLAVLLPTLRVYIDQQGELRALRAEVEQARDEVDHLESEVARWDDPAFVVAQARERLAYVFPGETPYRVIDPEFVTTHAQGSPAAADNPAQGSQALWYDVMWTSMLVAGNGDPDLAPAVEPERDSDEAAPLTDVDFGR